jgi:hypothetical protein
MEDCMNFRTFAVLAFVLSITVSLAQSPSAPASARVEFSSVPRGGEGPTSQGDIAGRVLGLDSPQKYKVVLYAHTDWWFVQPLGSDPYTDLDSNGNWTNWTHLGHRYAALVVRPSFKPNAKVQALPPVGGDVIAKAEVAASEK